MSSQRFPARRIAIVGAVLTWIAGCSSEHRSPEDGDPAGDDPASNGTVAGDAAVQRKLDPILQALAAPPSRARLAAMPRRLITLRKERVRGADEIFVDAFITADASTLRSLGALDITVRTVTSAGIATASVPLARLGDVAALPGVLRVEAAKAVQKTNDISQGLSSAPSGASIGMNNPRTVSTAGIVVGVIDTGIDFTHRDFIVDASETAGPLQSRVAYYWDQTDRADDRAPTDLGLVIGHEYTRVDIDGALNGANNTWDPVTGAFGPIDTPGYPIRASAFDGDGHGTHVAGSAAGDGSGSGFAGGAPAADLVIVKFDFDGDRNTEANIVDGVKYIFSRAAALGKPAVINMSLGGNFGPHDGSTSEERAIDALTGKGKIVMVAAGNPGVNNQGTLRSGYALHGAGALNTEAITFRFPTYAVGAENYVFFDIWYPGGSNKCKVKVTTPGGVTYPPAGAPSNTWNTGSAYVGYSTTSGGIQVGNGGDQLGWGDNNSAHEAYVEISDAYGTRPASGTWTIQLVKASSSSVCSGTYHAWYGTSANVITGWKAESPRQPTPRFGGRESDNAYTVGTPSTATSVLSVAAYTSRMSWTYAWGAACSPSSPSPQAYNVYPLDYYDPLEAGELAVFSGRGPRRDGVLKPEISAPGVGIASSLSHFVRAAEWTDRCVDYFAGGDYHYGTNRVMPGDEAGMLQGTSMATPNATGAVAVLLAKKRDLDAACLRQVFSTTARHDAATDTFNASGGSKTDTDSTAGPGKSNADWGHGKLDISTASAALDRYPTCTGGCVSSASCGAGFKCNLPTSPCGCGTCVACTTVGASCTANSQCCSNDCRGKTGRKTCR